MKTDTEEKRDEALSFLVDHDIGVLATTSRAGEPHARTVYYTCDDSFKIYFITLKNTRKADDLLASPRAAFVVSQTDIPRTIQIEGVVSDLTETATLNPLISDFVHKLSEETEYGIPLTHLDASELKFYCLTPTWIRWGEFTFEEGTDKVLTEVRPAA